MASGQVNRIKRPNTWLQRLMLQNREESSCQTGAVHTWHKCEVPTASGNVRVRGQSGRHVLIVSSSDFDPGCVKTCMSRECAELFSLSSSHSSGRKYFWFSN